MIAQSSAYPVVSRQISRNRLVRENRRAVRACRSERRIGIAQPRPQGSPIAAWWSRRARGRQPRSGEQHEQLEPDEPARPLQARHERIDAAVAALFRDVAASCRMPPRPSARAAEDIPAPTGTESHLCASQVIESACSMPSRAAASRSESDRGAAPRGVDVKPEVVPRGHLRELGQRIDHAGDGGSRGAHDQKWQQASRPVAGDLRLEAAMSMRSRASTGTNRRRPGRARSHAQPCRTSGGLPRKDTRPEGRGSERNPRADPGNHGSARRSPTCGSIPGRRT